MSDLISRQSAIDILDAYEVMVENGEENPYAWAILRMIELPSAQQWIPCSERLPESEDMYQIPDKRYLCQLEAYGQRKFCVCSRLKGAVSAFWDWYGVPCKDSEVVAWMPLPEPFEQAVDELNRECEA